MPISALLAAAVRTSTMWLSIIGLVPVLVLPGLLAAFALVRLAD